MPVCFLLFCFFGLLALTITLVTLLHILHFILCKKYDALLFKEPIFNQTELGVYSVWPFSLFRSTGYILLVGAPKFFVTKRRFKELTIERSNLFLLTFFCRLYLMVLVLDILFLLAICTMGVVSYFPDAGH